MSREMKIILIGVGILVLCGVCGVGTYMFTTIFPLNNQLAGAAATPVISETTEAVAVEPTQEPTSTPPADKLPFHSVVQITAQYDEAGDIIDGWTGSGSIISADGLILTNAHVVLPEEGYPVDYLMISLTGDADQKPTPSYYAEVMQADAVLDLAIVRITTDLNGNEIDPSQLDLPTVRLGDSDALALGDELSIMGYPGIGGETITLTSGEVSGFTAEEPYGNRAYIKTNATIAGGNSGGLAVNAAGELVGIPTQLGYGGEEDFVDCRVLADTNNDGVVDEYDSCIPTGGFINSLRPVNLALPFIERARNGEVAVAADTYTSEEVQPESSPETGAMLMEENFSDPASGWEDYSDNDGGAGYQAGKYQIDVTTANMVRWGVSQNLFGDVAMDANIHVNQATGEGDFGFLCRYLDEQNFYALEVSEDGYAAIWKLFNGEVQPLVDWTYIGQLSGSSHDVNAVCIGKELSLTIDGQEVATATDAAFASGDIGLVAGTNNVEGLSIAFDNLIVRDPSQ